MPLHPELPASRLGVATIQEYEVAGWSRALRRNAVQHGRLVRVAVGCFAPPPGRRLNTFQRSDLALARRAVAAAISGERLAASHLGSAYLQGCPIWAPAPRTCAATSDRSVRQRAGLHLHHVPDKSLLVRRLDVPMISMARTEVDIACEFGTEAALVTGDFALRRGMFDLAELLTSIEDCRGHTGIARARPLPELLDALAESPLESRSRWHMHEHDIPIPYSQVRILTLDGRFLGRVDHYWAEGVVGESDGRVKYVDNPGAFGPEKVRQQGMEDVDLEVARWAERDLRDFSDAAGRIERARARRRQRIAAGESPRWIATTFAGEIIPVVAGP